MKANSFIIILTICWSALANGQDKVSGTIRNEAGELLIGATVAWENTSIGTVSDTEGHFEISKTANTSNLIISYVGYEPMTVEIKPGQNEVIIEISGIATLSDVEVTARQRGNFTSTLATRNIESITQKELKKAPCCNLGESFESNAAVDVSYSDAITGAREIQMLGLRGIYTQLLLEKRPNYHGLGAAYALEYLPGTWLESIQISKGAGQIQTGFTGISGQINTEVVKPFNDKQLFVNLFGNQNGRAEANVHLNKKFNDKWSSGLLLHGNIQENEIDHDEDGFLNLPKKRVANAMYRLMFNDAKDFEGQFNVQAITDRRTAGQVVPKGADPATYYRIKQDNDRLEVTGKLGYIGFAEPYKSIGSIFSGTVHKMDAYYGNLNHRGTQRSFYTNLFYSTIIGHSDHQLITGTGFQYDEFEEYLDDTDFSRTERVPGVFAEYNFTHKNLGERKWFEEFALIAGIRVDRHNLFGTLVTPRFNAKLNFTPESIFRVSAGRGFRSANILAENVSYLASSRRVIVSEPLEMEEAWNMGANYTQNFQLAEREGSVTVDVYRTDFVNQIILDTEQDYQNLFFYNLDGKSFSNSFLVTVNYELLKGLDVKLAYKYNDVKTTYQGGLRERPLVAKHRGLATVDYETPNGRWMFNIITQIVGPQRLPDNSFIPGSVHVHQPEVSPTYALLNAQATWKLNDQWEFYVGGENLTNYIQHNPIIGSDAPFGEYFDATQIYAPIMGAQAYAGLRFGIK